MNRRQFIRHGSRAAAGLAFAGGARWLFAAPPGPDVPSNILDFSVPASSVHPQIVIASGDSPAKMTVRAIEALGGIGRFIAKGDRVILKPNASWDSPPELGANTHPEIMGALAELCLRAGAKKVTALDNTLGEPRRCFERSGIGPAVVRAGGGIEYQSERKFRDMNFKNDYIGKWPVFSMLFEADKFINVPVVKAHGISGLTATMKNLYGVIGGARPRLHRRIDDSIVSLANYFRPTLVVMDAFRVMVSNGPSGGRPSDLIHPRKIIAGTDQVALDTFAATLIRTDPADVEYLDMARQKGLGSTNYKEMRMQQLDVA